MSSHIVCLQHGFSSLLPVDNRDDPATLCTGCPQGIDPIQGRATRGGDIFDEENVLALDWPMIRSFFPWLFSEAPDDGIGFLRRKRCCHGKRDTPDSNPGNDIELLRCGNSRAMAERRSGLVTAVFTSI